MNARQELARVALELGPIKDDVADLKTEFRDHQAQHTKDREDSARQATATRRFRIAAGAAWVASITGVVALLVDISSKLH